MPPLRAPSRAREYLSAGQGPASPPTGERRRIDSLDGDLARTRRRPAAQRCAARPALDPAATAWRRRRHAVLVDEHQCRDQLSLRVEEVHLRSRRDHVGEEVADPRAELVDELDEPLAVSAHDVALLPLGGGPERGSRLIAASPWSLPAGRIARAARRPESLRRRLSAC